MGSKKSTFFTFFDFVVDFRKFDIFKKETVFLKLWETVYAIFKLFTYKNIQQSQILPTFISVFKSICRNFFDRNVRCTDRLLVAKHFIIIIFRPLPSFTTLIMNE